MFSPIYPTICPYFLLIEFACLRPTFVQFVAKIQAAQKSPPPHTPPPPPPKSLTPALHLSQSFEAVHELGWNRGGEQCHQWKSAKLQLDCHTVCSWQDTATPPAQSLPASWHDTMRGWLKAAGQCPVGGALRGTGQEKVTSRKLPPASPACWQVVRPSGEKRRARDRRSREGRIARRLSCLQPAFFLPSTNRLQQSCR